MATELNIPLPSYYDLEMCEKELEMCITLSQYFRLCDILKLRPLQLFGFPPINGADGVESLQQDLKRLQIDSQLNQEDFGQRVGWDVSAFLSDTIKIYEFYLDQLKTVSLAAKKDWKSILEDAFDKWQRSHRLQDNR